MSNYPIGADNKYSPWNEEDPVEWGKDVQFCFELRKVADVRTYDNEDDVNWLNEYKHQHTTPLQLIELLGRIAKVQAEGKALPSGTDGYWQVIAAECEGWENCYEDYDEDWTKTDALVADVAETREGIMGVMKLMKDAVDELSRNFENLKGNLNREAI